jgi:hypothetical protein
MQRGFLATADRLASAVRLELELGDHDRLDPRTLANKYGIPVVPITDLLAEGASPESIRQLTFVDKHCFSAGTVFTGSTRLIIFNPSQPDGRLAPMLLEHIAGPALGPGGCRVWNQQMEDEANLLASVLLVPRIAALVCARAGLPHCIGAARFGVSADLMQWRTDKSGAAKQARSEAQRRGRVVPRLSVEDLTTLPRSVDIAWLADQPAQEWLRIVRKCGRAIATASIANLIECLQQAS